MKIRIHRRAFSFSDVMHRFARAMIASHVSKLYLQLHRLTRDDSIVLYGHALDGNLAAFSQYLKRVHPTITQHLMLDDPIKYAALRRRHRPDAISNILSSQRISDLLKAAHSKVIVTSHGPITLGPWLTLPLTHRPLFVDAWHGVGYKGGATNFARIGRVDTMFAPSPMVSDFYEASGVPRSHLTVTGFARTDPLIGLHLAKKSRQTILKSYGLDPHESRKIVVYAPTWDEKDGGNIYPFNYSGDRFLRALNDFAYTHNFLLIFRPHINTDWQLDSYYSDNLRLLSARDFPLTEDLLKITDILVTDWSSIFGEYLALARPIIFVDKTPLFDGPITPLTLDDRPGAIVYSLDEFKDTLLQALHNPSAYLRKHETVIHTTMDRAWGATLDGHSAERYFATIQTLLGKDKFSR